MEVDRYNMRISFRPILKSKYGYASESTITDNMEKISEWYSKQLNENYENEFNFKIRNIEFDENLIYIDLTVLQPKYFYKTYIYDPDVEGLYPLEIEGTLYLVYYEEEFNLPEPYSTFYKIQFKKIKQQNPTLKTSQINKIIKNLWNSTPTTEKNSYNNHPINLYPFP